jgi:pilus assembly protein Flp/PilA
MRQCLQRFLGSADGATAVEYAVMLALILMVVFAAVGAVGTNTNQTWVNNDARLKAVNFGS